MLTRIAFHSENGPGIGGSDFYMGKLIGGLDRERYEPYLFVRGTYPVDQIIPKRQAITIVCTDDGSGGGGAINGTGERSVPELAVGEKARKWRSRIWQLLPKSVRLRRGMHREVDRFSKWLKSNRIEIFHCMDGGPLPSAVAAAAAGCRVVVGYSAPPPGRPSTGIEQVFERKCYQAADICVAKSQFAADAWSRHVGVDGEKFVVVPNGDDFPEIGEEEKSRVRSNLAIPQDAPVIGMTGRLNPEKGGHVLLGAVPAVVHKYPNAHFIFVGKGSQKAELEQTALDHGLSHRVHFLGFQPEAWRIAATYDIAVVPSVFDEPFGWVVIEAMAQGVPVVASRVGGIPEIIDSGENGLLVPRGDAKAMAAGIIDLLGNEDKRRALGDAGRTKYLSHYRRGHMLGRTMALYESTGGRKS